MKRILPLIFLLVAALMLPGCASLTGPSDYTEYAGAYQAHSEAKIGMASACSPQLPISATDTEKAYARAAAMMCVAMVSQQKFELVKPTTGMDVASQAVGQIPIVAMGGWMYRLGKIGIENAGQVNVGEGATLNNSLNPAEVHNTGSGTQTYSGTMPAAEPVIVEPVIVQ